MLPQKLVVCRCIVDVSPFLKGFIFQVPAVGFRVFSRFFRGSLPGAVDVRRFDERQRDLKNDPR